MILPTINRNEYTASIPPSQLNNRYGILDRYFSKPSGKIFDLKASSFASESCFVVKATVSQTTVVIPVMIRNVLGSSLMSWLRNGYFGANTSFIIP